MFSTDVAAAAPAERRDSEGAATREKTSLSQVLAQRRLHDGRKRRGSFLSAQIVLRSFCQVVGQGDSGSFHNSQYTPNSDIGECDDLGEVGDVGLDSRRSPSQKASFAAERPGPAVLPYLLS